MNWNQMSPARQKAATYATSVEVYLKGHNKTQITMTEATTAIWGTSGTGNANAVRIIEQCAAFGFLKITPHGKRARYITAISGAVPAEAMSAKDRETGVQQIKDELSAAVQWEADRMKRNIEAASTPQAKTDAFMAGIGVMLSTGRRR